MVLALAPLLSRYATSWHMVPFSYNLDADSLDLYALSDYNYSILGSHPPDPPISNGRYPALGTSGHFGIFFAGGHNLSHTRSNII